MSARGRRSEPQELALPGMELEDAAEEAPSDAPRAEEGAAEAALQPRGASPERGTLTAEQEQAVARRSEALLVSAAAGSGKTAVLVERFVRAVREDGIAPGRILAITFTERAAGELRARVRSRLLELGDREAARDTEAAFVGTFHGFCARLLRAHALAAGLDPDFAVLDEGLAARVRELAFGTALRGLLEDGREQAVDLLAAHGVDRVRTMVEGAHRELRSRGQRLPRLPVPARAGAETREVAECALLNELLERFGVAYEAGKARRAAVDFDDLELLARELLVEHGGVRAAWSERFELLMVDEFQDTNHRQLRILEALDRGNLFTVGDEFQAIYGFRHADVSLFRGRRAELARSGSSLALTRNFRARPPLLRVVNAIFADRFSSYAALLPGRDHAPEARGGASEGDPVVELLLTDAGGWQEGTELSAEIAAGLPHAQLWRQAEARMLAQRVGALIDAGQARAGEVVVLLRATGDLEVFERALQLRGLRTLAAVGAFWGHQQIGDLVSYLRVLANPLDEQALYGALASPLGGCSRDCLALLAGAAGRGGAWDAARACARGEGPLPAQLAQGDREALAGFHRRVERERAAVPGRAISNLIERAIEQSGYREHVLALDWGERRLANVHKLLRLARRFEAREGRDLRAFLDHVEHLREAVKVEADAPVEGVEPDAVRLMSVHAAKGLEFPVVCIADLGRQPNTQTPALLVDGERVGFRRMSLDGDPATPVLDYEELSVERRTREAEEEDRILYVAMTRARERLLLSGSVDFQRWPAAGPAGSFISWLAPALHAELPAIAKAGAPTVLDVTIGREPVVVRCRLSSSANAGTLLQGGAAADPGSAHPQPGEPERSGVRHADTPPPPRGGLAGERGEDARAVGGGPVPSPTASTLSYSSLSELERCGYRYYLERVLHLPEDRSSGPGEGGSAGGMQARARGVLVHRLLESLDFVRGAAPTPHEVESAARELGVRASAAEHGEIAELIGAALNAAPAARIAAAESVFREYPFAFSLGAEEPLVTGVIDLLARERGGGALVLDYKSDRVADAADLAVLVESEYGLQRLLYALAVLRDGAASVDIVHWFLQRPGDWVLASYTAADRPDLERRLSDRLSLARARGYVVSPRPHRGLCLTCPGRSGLCSWGETETMREIPGGEPGPAAVGASRT